MQKFWDAKDGKGALKVSRFSGENGGKGGNYDPLSVIRPSLK